MGLEAALGALKAAMTPGGKTGWRPLAPVAERSTILLDEAEAKALVARAGVPVPKGVSAPTLSALIGLAEGLVPPLALKGLGFAHKSEAGAVRLGLTDLHDQLNMEGATGYLAEEMVTGAVAELLIGLRRDPVYGVSLTVGLGGVTAELLADTVTLILPAAEDEIRAALARLKLWPLLDGYRGRAKADIAAVVAVVSRLATLMINDPDLEEIEINPLIVRQNGAVAVDALIRKAAP
ncbi:MAG: acetate--CoA ligase family protein, partial [Paracoccaceae bacterium]|nr:acetate--CoA ligase family protein [Paracoccaceae bacterium]